MGSGLRGVVGSGLRGVVGSSRTHWYYGTGVSGVVCVGVCIVLLLWE